MSTRRGFFGFIVGSLAAPFVRVPESVPHPGDIHPNIGGLFVDIPFTDEDVPYLRTSIPAAAWRRINYGTIWSEYFGIDISTEGVRDDD